jgi:hypothetical protein
LNVLSALAKAEISLANRNVGFPVRTTEIKPGAVNPLATREGKLNAKALTVDLWKPVRLWPWRKKL